MVHRVVRTVLEVLEEVLGELMVVFMGFLSLIVDMHYAMLNLGDPRNRPLMHLL